MKILGLLHDHIDGSRAMVEILPELYKAEGMKVPFDTLDKWQEWFVNPQINLVKKFGAVTSVLQTKDALHLAGYTYGKYRHGQGLKYVEGKFAPQYHTRELDLRAATAAMIAGLRDAEKDFGIVILPQVCIGREAAPDLGVEIAKVVLEYDGEVALDLACDEGSHPPEKHLPAYQLTFGSKVRRDCHAGEWVHKGNDLPWVYNQKLLKNVDTAVFQLKCHGVGHAIPLSQDKELTQYMVDNEIRVVGCPLSNLHSKLIDNLKSLEIDTLLEAGLRYTVSVDDDLLFPSVLELEEACQSAYGFTDEQWVKMHKNLRASAFDQRARGVL
jgi:adenosine deaminase